MATSLHLLIVLTVQVTFAFAAAPLKCLLRESQFLNVFSKTNIPASFYDVYKISPIQLDPLKVGDVSLDQDDLQLITKDLEYSGFSNAILDEFSISFNSNLTRIFFHSDVTGKGLYKISGSLFSVPVSGEGPFSIFFKNLKIEMVMPFETVRDENGRKYVNLKAFYFWHDISTNGEFQMGGLYNGNKELSETTHSLINENFRVIAQQFGKPFLTKIVEQIFNVFKNYMWSLPLRDDYTTC